MDPGADRSRVSLPVDALDVSSLRLILVRRLIWERVENPAFSEAAHNTMLFLVVVVAEGVDHQSQTGSFPRPVGREDEQLSLIAQGGHSRHEDIDRAAFPTLVLVEGPPGLLKAHFLDELVGALNEGLNVFRCMDGAGHDGLLCARHQRIVAENRRPSQESEGNQGIKCSAFHHEKN